MKKYVDKISLKQEAIRKRFDEETKGSTRRTASQSSLKSLKPR